ncbi:glycosyltransferase family 4 protein [Cyclobacterium jeungdonense]|uniref:Glycosyltransferase family 1 protein n=1 Tax=Cyclobacterium jeungdonense TaxID=708087 RepID=A0ABT8C4Y1_9BACT|nr:glycosyltransferase family 1 protein [Cyclobacterium jeungdonense]MDN3687157.1 glycosyltransferase family 1 protein [Cyclobacterium jeungdonense]
MKEKPMVVLVDVFFLHLAQTGIKTYIDSLISQIENYPGKSYQFIVYPSAKKIRSRNYFKGKTARWKNWLFQFRYFFHKLIVLPWLSYRYQADLVFCPDILAPLWSRGKRVAVIHDAFFWESPEHYHPLWRKIYLFFVKASLQRGTRVLTVSFYAKSRIERFLKTPHPIRAIPTGLNVRIPKKPVSGNSPLDSPYFLHVGVMEKRKNLEFLVQAFALFREQSDEDYNLVLVGQRGPRLTLDAYDEVVDEIRRLGLQKQVVLPGYLSNEELERYYHFATAYVFPSKNEGFGLPVLEAFSYGLPVVIGPQGALMEVGGSAVICSDSFNPVDLAKTMITVASDPNLRANLIARGRKRLLAFTGEKFFLSLQAYFKEIVDGN